MYSFPDTLYPTPQPLFEEDSMCFGFPAGNTIFYSRKDGNWSDITTWETVNGNVRLPGVNDIVYVRHTVVANVTASVRHLFVSGTLKASGSPFLYVMGNLQSVGAIDFTGSGINLVLYGVNNAVVNFVGGGSTVTYAAVREQVVMNLSYTNVSAIGGVKNLYGFAVSGLFTVGANVRVWLDAIFTDVLIANLGILEKLNFGTVIFNAITFAYVPGIKIDFTGNPDVEIKNGINGGNHLITYITGNGTYRFTTNNQSIGGFINTQFRFNRNVWIENISLINQTNIYIGNISVVNGTSSASQLINKGTIFLENSTNPLPMATGMFDYTSFSNFIGFTFNGDYILPSDLKYGIIVSGSGVKKLTSSVQSLTSIEVRGGATLDLGNGAMFQADAVSLSGKLIKTGAGVIKLPGIAIPNIINATIDFRIGAPSVELIAGLDCGNNGPFIYMGAGNLTFTTNNQAIQSKSTFGSQGPVVFDGDMLIKSITVTFNFSGDIKPQLNANINGLDNASILILKDEIKYRGANEPMQTGILDCSNGSLTYDGANQNIKGGTYKNILFGGSGVKKLMGNVVVDVTNGGGWSITGTATIDYNGFTITTI